MMIRLRYIGSPVIRREVGGIEWTPENGHEADAPVELAADLLTSAESGDWELAGKPAPKELKKLAVTMGLAPAELIVIPGMEPGEVENG